MSQEKRKMTDDIDFELRESAFSKRMLTFAILNRKHTDLKQFFTDAFYYFEKEIRKSLNNHNMIKVNTCLEVEFEKFVQTDNDEPKTEKHTVYIHTSSVAVDTGMNLSEFYKSYVVAKVIERFYEIIMKGSGFTLSTIMELTVQVNKYEPLNGASYIPLPKYLQKKHAIINVRNYDQECFKWAVLSALYPAVKDGQRVHSYYRYEKKVNFDGMEFPVKLNKMHKFESQNPEISVNVYYFDSKTKCIYPLRLTQQVNRNHIHLLLLTKEDTEEDLTDEFFNDEYDNQDLEINMHYCWIKDMSRLLKSQISKNRKKLLFCDRCLCHFRELPKLEAHRINCMMQNDCAIKLPTENNKIIKFKNFRNKSRAPFVVYADIEAILKPSSQKIFGDNSSTRIINEHEVYCVGYYHHCSYDERQSYYRAKRDPECIEWFTGEMLRVVHSVKSKLNKIVPIKMSMRDEMDFLSSSSCHICEREFESEDKRVRDHCHFTGKYRGAAHSNCNTLYRENREIPVIFHNLSGYDSHFIVAEITKRFEGG